jgi:hypothetical protein
VSLPKPRAGLVVRYAYLWADEAAQGHEEGRKDRPAAVILVLPVGDDDEVVVAPITHHPSATAVTIEIPRATARRLGLDNERQWIVVSDLNRFRWPGPDLRPVPGLGIESVVIGDLPAALLATVRAEVVALLKQSAATISRRSE